MIGPRHRRAVLATLIALGTLTPAAAQAAPPANDDFANAQTLVSSLSGTLVEATREPGEPGHHAGEIETVWYAYTPGATGAASIDVCDANFDAVLAVYTGSSVVSLSEIGNSDDGLGCAGNGTRIVFSADAGTQYHVVVARDAGTAGPFTIRVNAPPANDVYTGSVDLTTKSEQDWFNIGASWTSGEPTPVAAHTNPTGTVWFDWTAPQTGTVTMDTCIADFDTLLAVYAMAGPPFSSAVAGNDDSAAVCGAGSTGSAVSFAATGGHTYKLLVASAGSATGTFTLRLPPVNDLFLNATNLTVNGPGTDGRTLSNHNATIEAGEPTTLGNPGGKSLWFNVTSTVTQNIAFEACGSGLDTVLGVFKGNAFPLTPVAGASNDDGSVGCGPGATASFLRMAATGGTHYRVQIDGKTFNGVAAEGQVRLFVHGPSPYDPFSNADPGTTAETSGFSGVDNFASSAQVGEPDHGGAPAYASMWFRYIPPTSKTATITTCGSSFDTRLAVYTGASLGTLVPVAANDDTTSCGDGRQSSVTFDAVAGTTYRFAIDGKPTSLGRIVVQFNPPANDAFSGAIDLTGTLPRTEDFPTNTTSLEPGEPTPRATDNGSFWWKWTAPASGTATVDTCGTVYDSALTVYTGASVSSLTLVAANDDTATPCATGSSRDARVSFPAVAGTTYAFQVTGAAQSGLAPTKLTLDGPNAPAPTPGGTGGGSGTGGGGGGGNGTTTPTPRLLAAVTLPKPRSLRKLRRGRYAIVVRCRRACSVTAALTPRGKTHPVVARGTGKRRSAGRVKIVLKPTAAGRLRLAHAHAFSATLRLRLVDTGAGAKVSRATRRVSFH